MLYLLSLFTIHIFSVSTYDWTMVKQMVDLYHSKGAFPGAVLRVANETHNLFTY